MSASTSPSMSGAGGGEAPLLSAGEAARLAGGILAGGDARSPLRGAAVDTRALAPGMLFVALPGTRTDGHAFVPEAFRRGAGAALVARLPKEVPSGAALIRVPDTNEGD